MKTRRFLHLRHRPVLIYAGRYGILEMRDAAFVVIRKFRHAVGSNFYFFYFPSRVLEGSLQRLAA